jgi:hypothetical protein
MNLNASAIIAGHLLLVIGHRERDHRERRREIGLRLPKTLLPPFVEHSRRQAGCHPRTAPQAKKFLHPEKCTQHPRRQQE